MLPTLCCWPTYSVVELEEKHVGGRNIPLNDLVEHGYCYLGIARAWPVTAARHSTRMCRSGNGAVSADMVQRLSVCLCPRGSLVLAMKKASNGY